MFQNAHRLFGVCNIMKILRQLDDQDRKDEAMKSVIYESDMREKFPVHGCCGIIRHLYGQLVQAVEELQYVHARLVICREECHNQVVDHHFPPSSELQLGMNSTGNGLIVLQHHSPGANAMMPFDANQFVMNGNNGVYVEPNDDIVKGLWIQHPNYNNSGNDHVGIQSQLNIPESEVFPIQQQIEVDYDDIPFDTIADDRQSYIESKEACDSCSCAISYLTCLLYLSASGAISMENTRSDDTTGSSEAQISRMKQMLEALIETIRQQQRQQLVLPSPPPMPVELENTDIISLTQKFNKMKPPIFLGGIESLKAETWLLETGKIFEVFPSSETHKVLLATYTLKEEAKR
ncbi:hypothetical protein ACSBR1_010654 [Camellia fascicularis]